MSRTARPSSSRMNSMGLQVADLTSGRWQFGKASLCSFVTPKGSSSTASRPSSRRRRAAMHQSSPLGSMVTVDPSNPRYPGESRLSAMSAPLPVRGGATVMAEPSSDHPISGALRRPPHWPSRIPLRFARRRRKRPPSSVARPWRSDSARRRRPLSPRCRKAATATSNQITPSSTTAGPGTTSSTRLGPSSRSSQAIASPNDRTCCSGRTMPTQNDPRHTPSAPP